MKIKPFTFLLLMGAALGPAGRVEAQSACRQFTVTGVVGDGSTPLPTSNTVQIFVDIPCPGCSMGTIPLPGSKSFGQSARTWSTYLFHGTSYFSSPWVPLGTCNYNEALNCSDCDGSATIPLFARQGNIDGTVTDCTSGQGVQATAVLGLAGSGAGQKLSDTSGYFNFKAAPEVSGGNEWGVAVLDTGNGAGPGSADYVVDVTGAVNGGVSLGPVSATVNSSQLVTVQLFVKKTTVKEPGRCKPHVVATHGGGPTPNEPSPNVGAPVHVITGNVWFDRTDASVAVDGSSLSLVRSYNSVNRDVVGVLGRGWSHSFERHMNLTNPQTAQRVIVFIDGDGSSTYYQDGDQDQKYVAQYPQSSQHWVTASGGNYIREFKGGGSETYDSTGKLIAEADPQGRTKSYTYSGSQLTAVSSSGRTLTFAYNTNGRLTTATGPGNEVLVTYSYGPASANTPDSLQRVEYPDGTGYVFQYQGVGSTLLLTGVTDLEGKWIERHTYDASSRGITSEIADGIDKYTIAYGGGSTTVTDALNRSTVYEYKLVGAEKRVTKITGPCAGCGGSGSDVQEWTYDAQGRVLTHTDAEGGTTTYAYAAGDNDDVVSVQFSKPGANPPYTDPAVTYEYTNGFLSRVTGVDGSVTEYERDVTGNVTKIKDPLLRETSMAYSSGRVSTITDPRLKTTTMGYDATTGDLLAVTDPLSHATTFAYNNRGQRTTVTDALGHTTTTAYDGAGKVTRVTNHDGTHTDFKYDRGGRRSEVIDPLKRSTRYVYDLYGRLTTVIDPAGGATRYAYDVMGNLASLTDARNQTTSFEYNEHNQVKKTIYPGGAFETFTYDTLSRLVTMTDRKSVVTAYAYDAKSRLVSKTFSNDPSNTPGFSYTYDTAGRMLTAANGTDTLTWAYNLAGELLSEQSVKNASTVAYQYDDGGNRIEVKLDGTVFVTYAYDDASRLTTITRGTNVFGFGYDNANRRTSMTYPNGVTTAYDYDNLNRLTNLAATHVPTSTPITNFGYTYDAAGNRTQKSTLDYTEDYGYDPLYRLTRTDRTNPGATPPNQWTWNYDAVGNRTSAQKDSEATTSSYNEKNQLTGATGGGKMLWRGTLDEPGIATFSAPTINGQPARMLAGNVFEAMLDLPAGANNVTIQAQDGSGNVATKNYSVNVLGVPSSYTYDANGNLAAKTDGADSWTYTWNALNQLTAVSKNSVNQAIYSYDPVGRRIERVAGPTTTAWTYDAEDILRQGATTSSVTTTTRFVHGHESEDEPIAQEDAGTAVLSYLHTDGLGSITRHSNAAGAITNSLSYDAWGNIQTGTPTPFGFTGREWDAAGGLWYYRARYYDSKLGRFVSEDPIGPKGGLNFYRYVDNAPTTGVDPTGLLRDCDAEHIECFETCYNGSPIWPCKYKTACQYRLCQTKCLAEYMACEAANAAERAAEQARRAAKFCQENPAVCVLMIIPTIICRRPIPVPA